MSFRDFLSFPICKLFITVPKHTFLGLIKKSFFEPHVELNINRPPAILIPFSGWKTQKHTSMNSLNSRWTLVRVLELLQVIFIPNFRWINQWMKRVDGNEIICQFRNLLPKIWFWVLLKIYGDEIIVYFVLDAITLVFLTLKYWTRFKAFVFNFTK